MASERINIKEILNVKCDVTDLTLYGWVRSRRDSKAGFSFIEISDGSCFSTLQIIANQSLTNYSNEILKLSSGCSIKVTGKRTASQGKEQAFEVQAETVEVLGWIEEPETYPISKKQHTFEFLRTLPHLRIRTNTFGAMSRIRHTAMHAIHQFFTDNNFYWVNTPIISSSDCEGAGELFKVSTLDFYNLPKDTKGKIDFNQDFFGTESFLTVSGQLHLESYCLALSKVYTFGPTFRAENSNTSRHLAEFWMVEPEIAFATLDDITLLSEHFLKSIFTAVLKHNADDIAFFEKRIDPSCLQRINQVIDKKFVRIDYTDAVNILKNSGVQFEFPVNWGTDLQSEHERFVADVYVKGPVIVQNYPKEIKAFYMRMNDDEKTVAAMDVLAPGIGEIIGGSQREERLIRLDQKMTELNLHQHLGWYRDLRRYGTVPHAGFGLGFERLLKYITGIDNIRDTIPFPRVPGNAAI